MLDLLEFVFEPNLWEMLFDVACWIIDLPGNAGESDNP
jgi:hypothetical protein